MHNDNHTWSNNRTTQLMIISLVEATATITRDQQTEQTLVNLIEAKTTITLLQTEQTLVEPFTLPSNNYKDWLIVSLFEGTQITITY